MANPVLITCNRDQWTKVATNVTSGQIHKVVREPYEYLQTYVVTGDSAPVSKEIGVEVFENGSTEEISAKNAIDVYLFPIGAIGQVRVDL